MKIKWETYNPEWLVEIAKEQIPEEHKIIENLKQCVKCFKESKAYYYFVYSENPNEPNSDWQFVENIILQSKENGEIVLDILKDKKIGGIEFLNRL